MIILLGRILSTRLRTERLKKIYFLLPSDNSEFSPGRPAKNMRLFLLLWAYFVHKTVATINFDFADKNKEKSKAQ